MSNEKNLVTEEQAQAYRLKYLQRYMGLSEDESQDLISILTQDTPKDWIQSRPIRGGGTARYVPGYHFIERFNEAFGFLWSQEFPKVVREGNEIITQGRWSLQIPGRTITREFVDGTKETIKFDGFSIVKEQFGSAQLKKWANDNPKLGIKHGDFMDIGNDYKAAATDAMKKCGTELGMFLDVYGARETSEMSGPTDKQLEAFYLRAEKCGMDKEAADKWAEEHLEKKLQEADQQDVLGLVADLIDLAKEQK